MIRPNSGCILAMVAETKMLPERIQHVYWEIKKINDFKAKTVKVKM